MGRGRLKPGYLLKVAPTYKIFIHGAEMRLSDALMIQ